MSKEVRGYYNDNKPVIPLDSPHSAIFEAIRSHDGWLCPHCKVKSNPHKEEMSNQRYSDLIHNYEPLDMYCEHCGNKYYLKCSMTVKYYTCADESFGEEDE